MTEEVLWINPNRLLITTQCLLILPSVGERGESEGNSEKTHGLG